MTRYDNTNLCLLYIIDPVAKQTTSYKYFASQEVANYINDPKRDGAKTSCDGVFGALQLVNDYELNRFGLVATDMKNTFEVENMIGIIRDFQQYESMFEHKNASIENYDEYLDNLRDQHKNDDEN